MLTYSIVNIKWALHKYGRKYGVAKKSRKVVNIIFHAKYIISLVSFWNYEVTKYVSLLEQLKYCV